MNGGRNEVCQMREFSAKISIRPAKTLMGLLGPFALHQKRSWDLFCRTRYLFLLSFSSVGPHEVNRGRAKIRIDEVSKKSRANRNCWQKGEQWICQVDLSVRRLSNTHLHLFSRKGKARRAIPTWPKQGAEEIFQGLLMNAD